MIVVNANVCNGSDPAGCATLDPPEIHTGANPQGMTLDPRTQTLYVANELEQRRVGDRPRPAATRRPLLGCRARVPEAADRRPERPRRRSRPSAHHLCRERRDRVAMIDDSTCNACHTAGCAATPPSVTVGDLSRPLSRSTRHTHGVRRRRGRRRSGTVSRARRPRLQRDRPVRLRDVIDPQRPGRQPGRDRRQPAAPTRCTSPRSPRRRARSDLGVQRRHLQRHQPPRVRPDPGERPTGLTEPATAARPNHSPSTPRPTRSTPPASRPAPVPRRTPCMSSTAPPATPPTWPGAPTRRRRSRSDPTLSSATPTRSASPSIRRPTRSTPPTSSTAKDPAPCRSSTAPPATPTTRAAAARPPPPPRPGSAPAAIAVDPINNRVYATNIEDTSVTTINGRTCNGTKTSGCQITRNRPIVGDYPGAISLDPAVHTAYVADSEGVSVMPLNP